MKRRLGVWLLILLSFQSPAYALSPGAGDFEAALEFKSQGQIYEAADHMKKAVNLDPSNADYHFELANIYALQRDEFQNSGDEVQARKMLEASAAELEQAVMYEPDFLAAHFNLGVVYKKLGKYEAAREKFRTVLEMDPEQLAAQMQIGATYEDQGFFDEAETIYLEAREKYFRNPDVELALNDLAQRRLAAKHRAASSAGGIPPAAFGALTSSGARSYFETQNAIYPNSQNDRSASVAQAIPYLGSLLMQQFMKNRTSRE